MCTQHVASSNPRRAPTGFIHELPEVRGCLLPGAEPLALATKGTRLPKWVGCHTSQPVLAYYVPNKRDILPLSSEHRLVYSLAFRQIQFSETHAPDTSPKIRS